MIEEPSDGLERPVTAEKKSREQELAHAERVEADETLLARVELPTQLLVEPRTARRPLHVQLPLLH